MGWFSEDSSQHDAYNQVNNSPHKASLSHELIGGAASYEAMKAYEKHCAKNGKPASHAEAKELLAGFTGVFIDRIAETKGLNSIDKERAKHDAEKHYDSKLAKEY